METAPIDAGVRVGHVHLKVADLERALGFYHGVLGFEITQRYGRDAAFLSAGGYHHHIGLNTWESKGGRAGRRRRQSSKWQSSKAANRGIGGGGGGGEGALSPALSRGARERGQGGAAGIALDGAAEPSLSLGG